GSSGGVGGSGGVSGGIAPYTVLSGEVTVESDGCVHAAGAPGGQLLLDASIAGAATLTVTGQFLPVPGGASAVSLLQVCAGGALNGAIVEGCHLGLADQSTTDDTGGIAIYDTGFTEVANDSWTPSGTMHDYELAVTSDPGAETMTVSLSIDGVPAASASAPNLGSPSGNRIVLTMLAVSVCSAVLQ
ncbi:MAG: hypothetical protein KC731_15185, partial [Myxococcales bacterium]|nr:hypothetical protein [Myxococcales bacterium]